MDEDGYFVFDHTRVTDPEVGRPLIESLTPDEGNRYTVELNGQKAWLEAFNGPLVAHHVTPIDGEHAKLDLSYGASARFNFASLCVDEWDRFHGETEKGIPFVFSRQAQVEFFDGLDEFDDDSITLKGRRFEIPPWLSPSAEPGKESFWSDIYRGEEPPWELGRESNMLPNVLPQLKLNRSRVLVLGCGSGHDAAHFAQQGHVVTAVDMSPEAIQRAKANYSGLENLKIVQMDAFAMPRDWNERYDLIFEHTFYCAVSPDRRNDVVKLWNRALTPQGNLLGVFFVHEKRSGPPFGGSEFEVRERLKNHFEFLFWTRWRHSVENRKAKELVVFGRKKTRGV